MTTSLLHAAEVVRFARDHHEVMLWAEGGHLRLRSPNPLPPGLSSLLQAWKESILAFLMDSTLEIVCTGLAVEDADDLRTERAAILEYEAMMTRQEGERRAGLRTPQTR